MATLKYLSQYFITSLNVGGGIDASQTTGIVLQSVAGVSDISKPGQICVSYSDPIDTAVAEWINYTSINGSNELVGVTRGCEGYSAHTHLQGATVAFVMSASHLNDVVNAVKKVYNETSDTLLKATASEVATGTDDAKIVTPLSAAAYGNSSMARQAIINGNFDVWQRGTSVAWGDSVYTADRWMFNYGAVIAGTVTRQDGTGVYGSRYCTRVQRTAGASTVAINFTHSIESNDSIKFRGKKVTLSFYARKGANYSAASDYLVAKINTGTGTDEKADRYTGTATVGTTNAVLTTSWQKYTVTTTNVLADTVTELGIVFNTIFTGTAGAADYFEITQVQLCAGDVALPFQPKSFNQELIDCERYCQSFIGITNGVLGYGNAASATAGYISIPLKRAMFGTVGVTLTASDWKAGRLGDALVDVTSLGMLANYQGNNNLILELGVASGLPAGESIVLVADGTTRTLLVTSEL